MLWLVYVVVSIIFLSANSFLIKKLLTKNNVFVILLYQYVVSLLLVGAYAFFSGASFSASSYFMLGLGVIYVIAIALYYISLSKGRLSSVSAVFSLKMIVTASLGLMILLEPLTPQVIVGLGFGVLSAYLLRGDSG